jgi:CheY-like chemotaxis protein
MSKHTKILLADDDEDDFLFFQEALGRTKIEGVPASEIVTLNYVQNGVQALNHLTRHNTLQEDLLPDLIVLDLNMPILDGFAVLKEIKRNDRLKTIPVYLLTTSKSEEHKNECKKLGCAGFFSKPPQLSELQAIIEKMLTSNPDNL